MALVRFGHVYLPVKRCFRFHQVSKLMNALFVISSSQCGGRGGSTDTTFRVIQRLMLRILSGCQFATQNKICGF